MAIALAVALLVVFEGSTPIEYIKSAGYKLVLITIIISLIIIMSMLNASLTVTLIQLVKFWFLKFSTESDFPRIFPMNKVRMNIQTV